MWPMRPWLGHRGLIGRRPRSPWSWEQSGNSSFAATANTVSAYDGAWQPPLYYGQYNVAKAGSVIPVKILVGCNNTSLWSFV